MASNQKIHSNLYLLNLALLFTHEIDSAYWQEWDLFGLPGGIQVFLVLNFLLLLVGLYGFVQVIQDRRSGPVFSLFLAGAGLFAFGIHTYFLLVGRPGFELPVSLIVLGLILLVSLIQAVSVIKSRAQAMNHPSAGQVPDGG